jgi:hexosaminidase
MLKTKKIKFDLFFIIGHLEFLLKLEEFSDLRENIKYPQVITPCINKTYSILFTMIDQYLNLHPDIRLFHIGHDEVYYFLTNPACQEFQRLTGIQNQYDLFAHHLGIIGNYIREKNPNILLFVWHDVLQNLNLEMLLKTGLTNLVNPVLWSYREDISVEGFVMGSQAHLFGLYKNLWGASAFKGATHEIATISDVKRHYESKIKK